MAYDVNTITIKGAELLAAATAADKLVLDGCDATTTYVDAATAVAVSARPALPFSNTTNVSLIGYTAEHVQARASFVAGSSTGGDANTLYLYGHKQSAPSDIYVIYVASSQDSFHLPEVGDVANVYETLFDIIYAANANAVTTAGTSTYCTLAEFNLLKERTVTTHKEGIVNEGNDQTIYGEKTFKDRVAFDTASVTFGNYTYFDTNLRVGSSNTVSIGESNDPFENIYVNNVITDDITCTNNVVCNVCECSGFYCYTDAHITDDVYIGGGLEVDGNLEPSEDKTAQLGTYNYPFAYCYAAGLMMLKGASFSGIGRAVVEGTEPSQKITFGNSSPYKISIQSTSAYINMSSTGVTTGCTLDVTFGGTKQLEIAYNAGNSQYETTISTPLNVSGLLTCDSLTGNQPSYSSSTRNIKVGSIFMAMFDTGVSALYTGEEYHSDSTDPLTYTLKFAKVKGTYSGGIGGFEVDNTNVSVPDGKYVLLSDVDPTTNEAWAFVQCVSLD